MNQAMTHQMLVSQFHSFLKICQDKGLSYEIPDDETITKMSDTDLAHLVRQLRDVARTPTN